MNGVSTFQSGTPFTVYDTSAALLQDTDFVNTSNLATLTGPANKDTLLTKNLGGVRERLDNFVNLNAFVSGGNCVDNQNSMVSCDSPASSGFAALGNFGRNSLRGPFQTNWDMSVTKVTKLTERTNLEFRAEAFNVWNHASFQSPQAAGGSLGNFGLVDVSSGDSSILATVNKPRIIQFALKLNF